MMLPVSCASHSRPKWVSHERLFAGSSDLRPEPSGSCGMDFLVADARRRGLPTVVVLSIPTQMLEGNDSVMGGGTGSGNGGGSSADKRR